MTPQSSLADRPVQIRVRGLSPSQLVTLRAWLKDEQGERFQSRAFFRADGAGEVDPGLHAALGGSYSGVWPMGLLWFLQPDTLFRRLVKRDVAGSPFRVRLEVLDGLSWDPEPPQEPLASCEAERWFLGPGVQRVPVREGRVRGALFLPPGERWARGILEWGTLALLGCFFLGITCRNSRGSSGCWLNLEILGMASIRIPGKQC